MCILSNQLSIMKLSLLLPRNALANLMLMENQLNYTETNMCRSVLAGISQLAC